MMCCDPVKVGVSQCGCTLIFLFSIIMLDMFLIC